MKYFVEFSPDLFDSTTVQFKKKLCRLRDKLERSQSIARLETHSRPYFHANIGRIYRLIIERYQANSGTLIYFRTLLNHGDYIRFLNLTNSERQARYDGDKLSPHEVNQLLNKRRQEPQRSHKSLSDEERNFLETFSSTNYLPKNEEPTIFESYEWCDEVKTSWANTLRRQLFECVFGLQDEIETSKQTQSSIEEGVKWEQDLGVLYSYYPHLHSTLLIRPIQRSEVDESSIEAECKKKNQQYRDSTYENNDRNKLKRLSRRAYPSFMAWDEDSWIELQRDDSFHISLSPEEIQVLHPNSGSTEQRPQYPLFINGRAGSGKSTILHYLFAQQIRHYTRQLQSNIAHSNLPIYVTYSQDLLNTAKTVVKKVLRALDRHSNLRKNHSEENYSDDQYTDVLSKSFSTVRSLFLERADRSEQDHRFVATKLIQFHSFRDQWNKYRNQQPVHYVRELQPTMVWHVIRTYIKGMNISSKAEYEHLPDKMQSVKIVDFEGVINHAWPWYEQLCKEYDYWDDQDLAQYLLDIDDGDQLPKYSALFCDEAQDFTRIELDVIQDLLLYTHRDFSKTRYLLNRVPLAFAGDPYQTLHPTGFNWRTTTSSYYQSLLDRIGDTWSHHVKLKQFILQMNYRSSPGIVRFANVVQLIRRIVLGLKELEPQETWTSTEDGVGPVAYDVVDSEFRRHLAKERELVIIVPCHEGEEEKFRSHDDFLSQPTLDPRRIVSPVTAKGLEWDRIVLYRFGDYAQQQFPGLIKAINSAGHVGDKSLQRSLDWEYFLNQLYVSVTRARKRLIIADTQQGIDSFWGFSSSRSRIRKQLIDQVSSSRWKDDDLVGLVPAQEFSWNEHREDPYEIASMWHRVGQSRRNGDILDRAAYFYRMADKHRRADECEAEAFGIRRQFEDAVTAYKKLRESSKVVLYYWALGKFHRIVEEARSLLGVSEDKFVLASRWLREDSSGCDGLVSLLDELENLPSSDAPWDQELHLEGFKKFMHAVVERICSRLTDSSAIDSAWSGIGNRLRQSLIELGFSKSELDSPAYARICCQSGDIERGLELWRQVTGVKKVGSFSTQPKWLVRVRLSRTSWPDNVIGLFELQDYGAILQEWTSNKCPRIESNIQYEFCYSAAQKGHVRAARVGFFGFSDLKRYLDLVRQIDENNSSFRSITLLGLLSTLCRLSNWNELAVLWGQDADPQSDVVQCRRKWRWLKTQSIGGSIHILARVEFAASIDDECRIVFDRLVRRNLIFRGKKRRKKRSRSRLRRRGRMQETWREIHKFVTIREIGSVVERLCSPNVVRDYYWQFIGLEKRAEDRHFARIRYLVALREAEAVWSGEGKNIYTQRISKYSRQWSIKPSAIRNQPSYGRVFESGSVRDSFFNKFDRVFPTVPSITSPNIDITVQEHKQRIMLRDVRTDDTLFFSESELNTLDQNIRVQEIDGDWMRAWQVPEWRINCIVRELNDLINLEVDSMDGETLVSKKFTSQMYRNRLA